MYRYMCKFLPGYKLALAHTPIKHAHTKPIKMLNTTAIIFSSMLVHVVKGLMRADNDERIMNILDRNGVVSTSVGVVNNSIKCLVKPLPKYHCRGSSVEKGYI